MNLEALNKATTGNTRTSGISPFSEIETARCYANRYTEPTGTCEFFEKVGVSR